MYYFNSETNSHTQSASVHVWRVAVPGETQNESLFVTLLRSL